MIFPLFIIRFEGFVYKLVIDLLLVGKLPLVLMDHIVIDQAQVGKP